MWGEMFGLTHAEFERKRCPETLEKMNRYPGTVMVLVVKPLTRVYSMWRKG